MRSLLLAAANTLVFIPPAKAQERPNIVLMFTGNQGLGRGEGLRRRPRVPTPNIDRIAAEGVTVQRCGPVIRNVRASPTQATKPASGDTVHRAMISSVGRFFLLGCTR